MNKSVCIVANGYSRVGFEFKDNLDSDVWVWAFLVNEYPLRETDAVFELHCDIWDLEEHAWNKIEDWDDRVRESGEYLKALQETKAIVYMSFKDERIKNCVKYPFEVMINKFGVFFDNSISYMVALAIEKGYKEICLFGCEQHEERNFYGYGIPEYIIGIAVGRGIEITLPGGSSLLIPFNTRPFELYGIRERVDLFFKKAGNKKMEKYFKNYMERWEQLSGGKTAKW